MSDPIKTLNPGQTQNIFQDGHLTQVQHKGDRVDVVDHFDKGQDPQDLHIIHRIGPNGNIDTDIT